MVRRAAAASGPALYGELAPWFHLLTHPKSYAEEARFAARLLMPDGMGERPTLLELGSGGGNNAFHLKKRFKMVLTDISPQMLALSRTINPDCEHIAGDMRTLRLKRRFDAVLVHDAISYMTSERDLARAIKTAFVHCKPGARALFLPDDLRETFKRKRERGGHSEGGRSLRYVQSVGELAKSSTTVDVTFTLTLTERDGSRRTVIDRHVVGVFARETWLRLLCDAGFRARVVVDRWCRANFLATRLAGERARPLQRE
jgi:SAM-dependent methyltransferase